MSMYIYICRLRAWKIEREFLGKLWLCLTLCINKKRVQTQQSERVRWDQVVEDCLGMKGCLRSQGRSPDHLDRVNSVSLLPTRFDPVRLCTALRLWWPCVV